MSELIRMDRTGHTTVAQWNASDAESVAAARAALRVELEHGYLAVATTAAGGAEQVRDLPLDALQVILRRPIAGG